MQKSPNDTTANVQNTSTTTATQSESSYNEPQKISLKDYAQQNGLSYTELVDAIVAQGKFKSEAEQLAKSCGINWKEQAIVSAKYYLSHSKVQFTRDYTG